jgi:hypothetical protein
VDGFVDEVAHLFRSQIAAILGNLLAVVPVVLLICWGLIQLGLNPMANEAEAQYVLSSVSLLGPTALFAAFTGVLLFASSIIAGWVENAFVLHRLDSALRYRVQAPMIDNLMKDIGIEGGSLGRMTDVLRDAKDIAALTEKKGKSSKNGNCRSETSRLICKSGNCHQDESDNAGHHHPERRSEQCNKF